MVSLADSRAALLRLTPRQRETLRHAWKRTARTAQLWQPGAWSTWLILAGRGWGKTRTGAEAVRHAVCRLGYRRVAIVGRTAADVRDTMLGGPSGLLSIGPAWERPKHEPSKRLVTWPNGAVGYTYSADEPDQLRGPQHDLAWCDELAAWRFADAWDQLLFGLRMGTPRAIVTTTPRPTKIIRELLAQASTTTTRGSTYDNRANLAEAFFEHVVSKYEGTTLGRQELHAELLDDLAGALWRRPLIDAARVVAPPALERVVVGLDPSGGGGASNDEAGIVVAGRSGAHAYVLEDRTMRASPQAWASEAIAAFDRNSADRIVVEKNYGGEMAESLLRSIRPGVPVLSVTATRGKLVRAEPVAALYEQGRVHHVGALAALEDELCTYSAQAGQRSPNRLDALVWALSALMLGPQYTGKAHASGGGMPRGAD
jgi:phage terminase large subunit-like protein